MNLFVPKTVNRKIRYLINKMGLNSNPEYIYLVPEKDAEINECFNNVKKKILKDSGNMIIGWEIWETPLLIEAEYHAVWEKDNILIDITPKPFPTSRILFVRSSNQIYNGEIIDNFRINITTNTIVDDFIRLQEMRYKILNYKNRKVEHKIMMKADEVLIIQAIEEFLANLERYCLEGNDQGSFCYCDSSKKYYDCHGVEVSKIYNIVEKYYP